MEYHLSILRIERWTAAWAIPPGRRKGTLLCKRAKTPLPNRRVQWGSMEQEIPSATSLFEKVQRWPTIPLARKFQSWITNIKSKYGWKNGHSGEIKTGLQEYWVGVESPLLRLTFFGMNFILHLQASFAGISIAYEVCYTGYDCNYRFPSIHRWLLLWFE